MSKKIEISKLMWSHYIFYILSYIHKSKMDYSNPEAAYYTFCRKKTNAGEFSTEELINYWLNIIGIETLYGFSMKKKSSHMILIISKNKSVYLSWYSRFWTTEFFIDQSLVFLQQPIGHVDMLFNFPMIEKIAKFFNLSKQPSTKDIDDRIKLQRDILELEYDQYRIDID